MRLITLLLGVVLAGSGCATDAVGDRADEVSAVAQPSASATEARSSIEPTEKASDGNFPDVLAATATAKSDQVWDFAATLSSPYDSPQRYADAWRVLAPDGTELGVRVLTHDHAGEQPFTRTLLGVTVPEGVTVVTVQGRDQVNGWGGSTVDVELAP